MKKPTAFVSTLTTAALMCATTAAVAGTASTAVDPTAGSEVPWSPTPVPAEGASPEVFPDHPRIPAEIRWWEVRLDGSLVEMRDAWLAIATPELGLTVGRRLSRSWSVELTGSARASDREGPSPWSAMAAARWAAISSRNGRHQLTLAAGPFVEVNNIVHGTIPFAHAEVAYVYQAPFGLTVLAGFGPNIALASSSYVTPAKVPCNNDGDSFAFCLDLGPDAQEIHAGDRLVHMRLALGWQF